MLSKKSIQRLMLALILVGAAFTGYLLQQYRTDTLPPQAAPPIAVTTDEFGIETTSLMAEDREIERNQTFSDILSPHNIPFETIASLADKSRPTFNVRHLRAGNRYRIYLQDDSLQTAQLVIYEQDPINYVVFDLRDSVRVETGQRPVSVTQRNVSGVITSSLYNTLVDQNVDPALATELSEVFAWQIDFYRIQKNDGFNVIYEERSVEGKPVGVGKILAASFKHFGRDYYSFLFEQDGRPAYFDEKGNSMRKAFLMAPVKFSRISSRYTLRRFHPVQKRYKAHLGTDYAAPQGTEIRATGNGVVLEAQYKRNNGNYVKIKHNGTYTTGYLHMSKIASGIRPGATVSQGQVIGYVGSTGLATGPHVCYRFWKNNVQVDPLREKFPTSVPIKEENRAAFTAVRDQQRQHLDTAHFLPYAPAYAMLLR